MTSVGRFLSPAQAAARLTEAGVHVSEDTVRRWARSGELHCIRLPLGRILIATVDIDAITAPASGAA